MNTTLEILLQMPEVTGHELDDLLATFHSNVERLTDDETDCEKMYAFIQSINPYFIYKNYSESPEANILANIVAGIYAPLIHGFSHTILANIQIGNLPQLIVAPPRDAYPLVTSLRKQMELLGLNYPIIMPPVNRLTAGISNAQGSMCVSEDPLFDEMLKQFFQEYWGTGYTEVETGIYGTTSLVIAQKLKGHGMKGACVPIKFYGLGPNISYIHALLGSNGEWNAECSEERNEVDVNLIAKLMVLLDSLEEFGMQNFHETIPSLFKDEIGMIQGTIVGVDECSKEIARATNEAITQTAKIYDSQKAKEVSLSLINNIDRILFSVSNDHWPLMLEKPIPPMAHPTEHFNAIKEAGVFTYPNLVL